MKKLLCILLAVMLLAGCGAQGGAVETTAEPTVGAVTATLGGAEVTFEPWEQAGLPESGDAVGYLANAPSVAAVRRIPPVLSGISRRVMTRNPWAFPS